MPRLAKGNVLLSWRKDEGDLRAFHGRVLEDLGLALKPVEERLLAIALTAERVLAPSPTGSRDAAPLASLDYCPGRLYQGCGLPDTLTRSV
jgi:hypothetical protein